MTRLSVLITLLCLFAFSFNSFSQDLTKVGIRKINLSKKAIYINSGIFHNGANKVVSNIKAMRHSFAAKEGYERIVFDFGTAQIPRIYGHFNGKEKKLYVDFFDTTLDSAVKSFGKTRFVEEIKFFPVSEESLSLELVFKDVVSIDLFYLENPGRLVVDVKK